MTAECERRGDEVVVGQTGDGGESYANTRWRRHAHTVALRRCSRSYGIPSGNEMFMKISVTARCHIVARDCEEQNQRRGNKVALFKPHRMRREKRALREPAKSLRRRHILLPASSHVRRYNVHAYRRDKQ